MQLNVSSLLALPEATPDIVDDAEAERILRLIARMAEAKRMLNGVLANLARVEASMVAPEPDDLVH